MCVLYQVSKYMTTYKALFLKDAYQKRRLNTSEQNFG